MCFSPEVSFTAAALLIPTGIYTIRTAARSQRRYLAAAALPLLFGIQQGLEGLVWTSGSSGSPALVNAFSIAYMFFAWLAWPVWVPFSTYCLEPPRRQLRFVMLTVAGAVLGAGQFLPYLVHNDWLTTRFLPRAIVYGGVELFDFVLGRDLSYALYLSLVIVPPLLSSDRRFRPFGLLVAAAFAITYLFFRFAYISVFCFGGALMSGYLVWMVRSGRGGPSRSVVEREPGEPVVVNRPRADRFA